MTGSGDGVECNYVNFHNYFLDDKVDYKTAEGVGETAKFSFGHSVFELTVDNQVTMSAMQLDK